MELPAGLSARTVETERLSVHVYESGPSDGVPVVLLHGNLSTGRFYDELMLAAPGRYRLIAPDMRGFGRTERVPLDATRGLRDWADDTEALLRALGITRPVHVAGWSTGGAAVATLAQQRPVASLTLIDPVAPHGFGGVRDDGTPCFPDFAGSGGGTGNPDFTARLASGDRSQESPTSPLNVLRSSYWPPDFTMPPERESVLLDEVLMSETGDDGYPGDAEPSENWPGVAPGTRGILNALSPKFCDWSGLLDVEPKPPLLWVHGERDVVIADGSPWEMGALGQAGQVPGWPGADVFPPQQMVAQIGALVDAYRSAGGSVRRLTLPGSGHAPFLDAGAGRFAETLYDFLDRAEDAGT
ncbi:alpha/beta fold hydrolase [Blastococcus sp. VKM Ac-2987]|uniref:alpha/beta fold hydrolase n=1 Tax=Blastococcus sp. VKM Ac-2987 TaxID=3004141 RepID=UPI0022AB7144|nr:alpha/beta hydrolase [Blastococcus sp. VKM Ac-2987]MCZ2859652.1 alpha/beta hydrolase [Blastococcus sp. VKM Ac-2987]